MATDGGSNQEQKETNNAVTSEERGVYDFADGGRYIGDWKNGGADGYGVCVGPMDSGVFQGKWVNGHQCSGVFKWNNGQRYLGTWKNGSRHGLGVEVRPDGSEYTGDFQESIRGPFGVLRLSSGGGALYRGTWEEGLQDGVGVEVYTDKGVYKGQYKKGFRNGYGTRSSYGYELYEKKQNIMASKEAPPMTVGGGGSEKSNAIEESPKRATSLKRPASTGKVNSDTLVRTTSSTSIASNSSTRDYLNMSGSGSTMASFMEKDSSNCQIYEGQWYKDKRHGHGVLRVPGSYTYCGEWSLNNRTGNGILRYEDGRREEGVWEKGQLVMPLKRKKISIKYHQLEAKVKQAHTLALQAADVARTKSLLAESRATAASSRAKLGIKAADEASMNADAAKEKADQLYSTEHKVEDIPTPTLDEAPPFSLTHSMSVASNDSLDKGSDGGSLNIPSIALSPSMESFTSDSIINSNTSKSPLVNSLTMEHSNPPSMGTSSSYSSLNSSLLGAHDGVSLSTPSTPSLSHNRRLSGSYVVLRRSSDHVLEKQPSAPSTSSEVNAALERKIMGTIDDSTDAMEDQPHPQPHPQSQSIVTFRQPWNKETQQIPPPQEDKKQTQPQPATIDNALSIDVIKQMANWNKTIAYINFILLLFLLLLIVFIVAFLSTTISQNNPANFMTHMA